MMDVDVVNQTRSLENPLRVKNCESFGCRLKGLMFQKSLDVNGGLLMVQKTESKAKAAIHMFFVKMELGVIWLDSSRQVVDLKLAKSWQPMYTPQSAAKYILEVHPRRLPEFQIGDQLSFE
ncbi:MAG TPA: DUF192 domain-containing protein [Chloroflexi bacterium]|nr:DUF192 domain-containing protein [Chloroflexota bacterium]